MKILVKVINVESGWTMHFSKFSKNFLRKNATREALQLYITSNYR